MGGKTKLWAALLGTTMLSSGALAQEQTAAVEEVIVTAQKRSENLQSVPLAIQALGEEKLDQLQVTDFNDFAKFLPSVTYKTSGPGFTNIYMRGVSSGENSNHSGPLPSVGFYLDEQPVTTITGPLDIHVYDIARVEALSGPQGTLYGASSQAGTIRIITNKPSSAGFEAGYDVELNTVAEGDAGYVLEGFVNQPLGDRAAIRLVGWHVQEGGYIDQIEGERCYPTWGGCIDAIVQENANDVETTGARAALRIDLNDSWTITPAIMGQVQQSGGIFAYQPNKGDLKQEVYYPNTSDDRWYQAALTIEGKLANLDLTYAGAYMKRDVDGDSDYSDYSYFYDVLYGYGAYWTDDDGDPVDPTQYIRFKDRYEKTSHEIRLTSPAENRFRYLLGAFYQKQEHGIEQRYQIDGIAGAISVTGWPNTLWLTKQLRIDRDYAVFGEASFDFTDKLTGTAGVRFFKSDNSLEGFFGYAAGYSSRTGEAVCFGPATVAKAPCNNVDKSVEEDGYTHRLNLEYQIDADKMIYATWSTGFRPGGINRRGTLPPYDSDRLINYEIGWKTTLADGALRFNGAVFMADWEDIQFSYLGANGLTEIQNAGAAEMKGVESQIIWRATPALTITGSAAYTDATLAEDYCPGAICPDPTGGAPAGTQLPITSKWKGDLTARYEFQLAGYDAFAQGSLAYQDKSWSDLRTSDRQNLGVNPSYETIDLSTGIDGNGWTLQLFAKNVTDERGSVTRFIRCNVCQDQPYYVPIQPRLLGVRFGQKF